MSRLTPLAALHQGKTTTNGSGFRAWETRRNNLFLRAIDVLGKSTDADALRLAAHEVSEHVAGSLPEHADVLTRGYRVVANKVGDRSISIDGKLFSPAFNEPCAEAAAIVQFALDLKTGWLREIGQVFEAGKAAGA